MEIGWFFPQKYFFLSFSIPVDPHSFLPWELKRGSGEGTDFKSWQGTESCSAFKKVKLKAFILPFRKVWGSNGFEGLWIWLSTYAKIIISLNGSLRPKPYPDKSLPISHWLQTSCSESLQISLSPMLSLISVGNGPRHFTKEQAIEETLILQPSFAAAVKKNGN